MRNLYLIIGITLLLVNTVKAQQEENAIESHYINHYDRIVPETPNASNFTVYGDVPVDHSTGVPNISIPLYTIEEDGVQIPISISYHASGVRVDELASAVGLKWTLNAGGGIFRTIKEKPDERNDGWLVNQNREVLDPVWFYNQDLAKYNKQQSIRNALSGIDQYSDKYRYMLPAGSGSFQYSLDGRILKDYADALRVERNTVTSDDYQYEIFAPNGGRYFFGATQETSQTVNITGKDGGNPVGGNASGGIFGPSASSSIGISGPTGWMLDHVESKHGYAIDFTYEPYHLDYELKQIAHTLNTGGYCPPTAQNSSCFDKTGAAGKAVSGIMTCGCEEWGGGNGSFGYTQSNSIQNSFTNQLVKTIDAPSVLVTFIYQNVSASHWKRSLSKIMIKDKINNKTKSFEFTYSTFPGDPRLRLDRVQEVGFNGERLPAYEFAYISGGLPKKDSKGKDYKGYNNGKEGNTTLVAFSRIAEQQLPSHLIRKLGDRSYDERHLKAGTLKSIKYPTGGRTEFNYEANAVINATDIDGSPIGNFRYTTKNIFLDAVTAKSIRTDFDFTYFENTFDINESASNIAAKLNYSSSTNVPDLDPLSDTRFNIYRLNEDGTKGTAVFTNNLSISQGKIIGAKGSINVDPGRYILELRVRTNKIPVTSETILSDVGSSIRINLQWFDELPGRIFYTGGLRVKEVKNYEGGFNLASHRQYQYEGLVGNASLNFLKSKGYNDSQKRTYSSDEIALDPVLTKSGHYYKTVTIRNVDISQNPIVSTGNDAELEAIVIIEKFEDKPMHDNYASRMIARRAYNATGDLVQETLMDYTDEILEEQQYWIMGDADRCYSYQDIQACAPEIYKLSEFGYGELVSRKFFSRKSTMTSQTSRSFPSEGTSATVQTTTQYTYNDDLQVTEQTTTNSDGSNIKVNYTYPALYNQLFGLVSNDNHLVSTPVSKLVFNDNLLIAGQYFSFNPYGDVTGAYSYNRAGAPEIDPAGIAYSPHTPSYIPIDYQLDMVAKVENGKPVEVLGRNGVPTTYIWSYQRQYPVAKIDNATASQVSAILGVSINQLSDYNKNNLASLDGLRAALPSAHVTTYEYEPMIGMLEATDPNGRKTSYQYDGLGRLLKSIDHEGHVLQQHDYIFHSN